MVSNMFILSKADIIPLKFDVKLFSTDVQWPTNFIDLNIFGIKNDQLMEYHQVVPCRAFHMTSVS